METWRDIAGFEGRYQVSDQGRVRSLDRTLTNREGVVSKWRGRVLKPQLDGDGYRFILLGRGRQHKLHRLVAQAFLPNPSNLPEVDHENEDKSDCRASNLRWCTRAKNNEFRHRTSYKTCEVRFGLEVRVAVAKAIAAGRPVSHVARDFKMSRAHVRRVAAAETS